VPDGPLGNFVIKVSISCGGILRFLSNVGATLNPSETKDCFLTIDILCPSPCVVSVKMQTQIIKINTDHLVALSSV
jgi:hypothetical protein